MGGQHRSRYSWRRHLSRLLIVIALAAAARIAIIYALQLTTLAMSTCPPEPEVTTRHSFTGRMCAASRDEETRRTDSLFSDQLGVTLAGTAGMASPMGSWILVPRTRYGDDHLVDRYTNHGARQLVLLGAGMDSRAYRSFASSARSSPVDAVTLPELKVFEVDQQTTFDIKEPLLESEPLTACSRTTVGYDFATGDFGAVLLQHGFDPTVPSVWLLEGLLYYLSDDDVSELIRQIGVLSAVGSSCFHDAVSAHYIQAGIAPGGAPFISGSDQYKKLWSEFGGFEACVYDFKTIRVNRRNRRLESGKAQEVGPEECRGRDVVLFVEAVKA